MDLKPIVRGVIALLMVLSFLFILAVIFLGIGEIPKAVEDTTNTLLGVLTAAVLQILNFYFGDKA